MAVSDGSGGVLYRFVYDTYGELSDIKTDDGISLKNSEIVSDKTKDHTVEELAHAAGLTYLYNGQYGVATDQNGLYYMRARYYDQDIKRFINRDIVSGDISNSKSLNRYAYVQGNPVSLTDPFGLCPDINSSARMVQTFLCDTDWSTVGHTALDIVGIFWDGADLINVFWYAAEGNTEMAITSAVYALPGIGMASGRLMMCSDKLYKAGKAVYRASKLTQGCYGVIGGLTMAGAGIGNIYNSLKNGEKISLKDILLAAGGTAIAIFSGKTTFSDMKQMLGLSNKVDRTIKVGNADISHEPVPSEKKILEAAESGRAAKGGNVDGATFEGTIYRSVDKRYDPLEMSQYTIDSNHRYTEGGMPGLYFSSGEKIVKAELANYDTYDFSNRIMYSYDVKLTNMLDVSNPCVRSKLGVSLDNLVGESYDVTHRVGRYAYANGYNGIIAPSARADGGVNIILFSGKGVK